MGIIKEGIGKERTSRDEPQGRDQKSNWVAEREIKTGDVNYTFLPTFDPYCCCYQCSEKKYFNAKITLSL